MLIDYVNLTSQLSTEAIDGLIHEYLYQQIDDLSFEQINPQTLAVACSSVREKLATAELIVEYSEENQSVTIKNKEQLYHQT